MLKVSVMVRLKRVYHPVCAWEEARFNMYGAVDNRKEWLLKAIELTGNHALYGSFMQRVISEWPISCENALTDNSINKKAWIGHAAVALAIQCPEDIVREAWGKLTDEQRLLANKEAERAIRDWTYRYCKSKRIYSNMEESLL